MSDCSRKPKERPKKKIDYVLRWKIDDPDDTMSQITEVQVNDHKFIKEQRYQQLEQLVRDMYLDIETLMTDQEIARGATPTEAANRARFRLTVAHGFFMKSLGVEIDD